VTVEWRRWLPVLALVGGLGCVAPVALSTFGFSSMATDACPSDGPCPAWDAILKTFAIAIAMTLALSCLLVVLTAVRRAPRSRWPLAGLTLAVAAWPVFWIWILGGPALA
jgi:uncharacterized BrkB/YihY/UPF0761 family membrane protein